MRLINKFHTDERGIKSTAFKIMAGVIVLVIGLSISIVVYKRASEGEETLGATLPPQLDLDILFKDNDTQMVTYNVGRGWKIADDNIVYIRIAHVGGGRVCSPADLVISFAFYYDNLAGGADLPVSAAVRFPDNAITTTYNCSVTTLIASTSAEGYFESGNMWLLKAVPTGVVGDYAVYENKGVYAALHLGGKDYDHVVANYWTITENSLG